MDKRMMVVVMYQACAKAEAKWKARLEDARREARKARDAWLWGLAALGGDDDEEGEARALRAADEVLRIGAAHGTAFVALMAAEHEMDKVNGWAALRG